METETRRIRATPTPKKRAFGTNLSANSPFPHQRQQQPKSTKKQLQWSDKEQFTSTTTASSGPQSSRRYRNTNNNDGRYSTGKDLVSTPYNAKTPTKVVREGTPAVKWSIPEAPRSSSHTLQSSTTKSTPGRVNLFSDFNSPTIPSNVATPGLVRRFDTPHRTQKLTYAKIAAGSPSPKPSTPERIADTGTQSYLEMTPSTSLLLYANSISAPLLPTYAKIASGSPPSKQFTPEQTAATTTTTQSYLTSTPPTSLLLAVNTPYASSLSPSASTIRSNSTTATSLADNATSIDVPETIAPSEYVIEFPPGPIHLKLDPVVYTLGKPVGCSVAQILPDFDTNLTCIRIGSFNGETNNAGIAATTIQVNDLIVSINGTNVLSRKFDVITDLLHKIHGSHKIIVFRSIEKVWKSQFQRKTMRNLRNGRRVATALSNGQMESNLHSWVETPTKVEVVSRSDRRSVASGDKLESISEISSFMGAQTPSGDIDSRPTKFFSPSNVKKVMSQRNVELVLSTTPTVFSTTPKSPYDQDETLTEKKSDITAVHKNQGSGGNTPKQSPIHQINTALVGVVNSDEEFECSLRLKKNVLKELNGVCMELAEKSVPHCLMPESGLKAIAPEVVSLGDALPDEVSLLKERVRELTNALATAEDEAREREDDLEEKLLQLQNQLSSRNDVAVHVAEVRRQKEEKDLAVKEVQQQLEKERAFFQERVEKGKKSKQELIGKLDATQIELKKNKSLCADLEKKFMSKKEMKAKLQASKSMIQALETEKIQFTNQLKDLQRMLSARDAIDKDKQAELAELLAKTQNLQHKLSERDSSDKGKQAELDSLSSSLTEKALELEKMVVEVTNLKQHLSLSEKKGSADRGAFKVNKMKLVEECEELKALLTESENARNNLQATIEEQEIELSRRQTLLNDVKKRNYSLQDMVDELTETLEKANNVASEQLEFLEKKLKAMRQELDESRSSSFRHLADKERLQEEKQKIQGQLSKVTKELEAERSSLVEKQKLSCENEFLGERVGELTETLAKAEADSREREDFLEKKLQIVTSELEETRLASDLRQNEIHRLKREMQKILSDANSKYDGFKELLSTKEEELRLLRKQAEEESLLLEEQLEIETKLKSSLEQKLEATKDEHNTLLSRRQELLDDMEKHNAMLRQRVGELTDCLAQSEDDAREREDALEEKLQQMGVELIEGLRRVEAEKETSLHEMHQQMEDERSSFRERIEREERSKAELMDEFDATKDHLIQSEASNMDLQNRLEEERRTMEMKVSELNDKLEKAYDDAREREDSQQEELYKLRKEIDEANLTAKQKDISHELEVRRVEGEKQVLFNDNTNLHNQLEGLMSQIEMGESAKIDLQGRVEALDRAKSVHEKSLSRRQELLDDMEARIKALKERVSELTDCLAKAEDDAREREDALEEKLQEMGTQFEEAKITFNKENATRLEFVNLLTVEKEKLGLQLSRLHDETVELKDQISVLKITNYDLETQLEGLKASNSMFEDEAKELNEKIDKVNQDASFSKALCVDLKSKLEAAERLLDESDAEINTLSYDCDCLEKKVENLNAQLECHDGVISDQKAQIESLLEDIAVMKGEKKSLIEDLESQMAKVLLSEDEKLDLVERIESLEASLNANEDTKLKVMSERDSLKSTADDRLALLQQLQGKAEIRQSELLDSLAAKEFEIASLTSQREELKGKLEDLGYRFDQLLIQSKKDSESFQSRLGQLLDEISTVNAQKDNYALQTKSLEAKVERIEAQSIQEKEAHKSTERQLLMDVRNSQNTISGAKLKLIHVENELQSIKSQLTAKDSEISKLVDEKERLANELCTALDKVEMEVKANALTQNEHTVAVKQLVTDVEKKHALCVDLTSRLKTLTSAMNVKQEEVISLKNDLSYAKESIRMLQSEKEMSMSTLESKLLDTRSQFEAERQSLKELIGDLRESQQSLLEQRASSIEASLRSQFEISRDEISNAKRIEGDLRERLEDVNTLLHEKIHEIQELNSDILSEKEGRRQELFEMKCLYEKKFQELTSCSLDIEAEKSISENKVKKLTQDVAVSLERESSLVNRIHELEQLLQSQNHDLVQVNSDLSAKTAAHDKALSDMERTYAWNVKELKDLHDTERNELLQQMSDISGKLKLCQVELIEQRATQQDQKLMMEEDKDLIQRLRAELEEGINLNASLSTNLKKKDDAIEALQRDLKRKEESLIAADRDYKAKIEEKKSFHEGEKQNLVDEIAKFSMELEWSLDQIDKKQKIIDTQRLSLNDENNELVKELSKASNTEMKLRKLFNEAYMEVSQLSIDFASTRGDIVFSIAEARSSSEETLLLAFQTFKATAVKWAAERVSYEDNVKSLSEDVHELNKREQHLRSQVDALRYALEVRDQTVDELSNELTSAKNSLSAATSETQRTRDLSSQVEELRFTLESRDQSIEDLSIELISVKENLSATDQEFEHVKAKLGRLLNELNEMNLINANLREEMSKLETAKQLSQSKVETATTDLNDLNLKNEFLLDEIDKLKSDLRACHHSFDIERGNYESNIAFISSELKSSSESFALEKESFKAEWRHFQLLLKHLVDSIDGNNDINEFNSSKHSEDLPDISTQLGKLIELVGNKEELILQLQLQIENLQIHHDQIIEQHTSSEEDPETIRLLSEIEEAKIKVIGMDSRFISERKKRKDLEAQLSAESKSLTEANKELTVKESIIDELEESVQLKLVDIKKLESRLCKNYDLHEKLEGKYEVVKSELEVSQNLATELKQIIIDKNEEIESKEGRIMELQFQVDDLASQADGWRASLEALTSEADGWKATLQDLKHDINDDEVPTDTEILSLSSDLRDELSKEIVRLEEKILVMDKDQRQQCSMHKSIVDGLEARCDALSQENTEAQGYISSLEDSKVRLQVKINSLRNDCDVQRRRLSELESVFIVMKQQKSVAETLCDDVLSGLRKLTGVAIMYSSRLEGFSEKLSSPSSWSVNLEYISRFIECALKLNQKYFLDIQKLEKVIESLQRCGVQNIAEAITPKAKGSGDCRKENSVMPQHLDVINDIKNMKDAIKNLMTSPKLTPEKGKQMSYTEEDKDGDLYSDLLTAYDQLEVLSKKIVTYQDDQALWKDRESTLQARIKELEADKLQPRLSPKAEDLSGAEEIDSTNLNESSAVIVSTDTTEQDLRKAPQTEALKHANIVKAITRELNSTRKKVHELKTKLIIDTR